MYFEKPFVDIDVDIFWAICKKTTCVLFPLIKIFTECFLCIYLMAIMFLDISSYEMLCNIKAFDVKKGPFAEKQTKLGVLIWCFTIIWGFILQRYLWKVFFFFLQHVLYKICNKVTLRRKYWCLHSILLKSWYIINSLTQL